MKLLINYYSSDKVTLISFELIHPNPGRKEFNSYNNLIHGANLKELDIKMTNNEEGIKLGEDKSEVTNPIIADGIELIEKGYGHVNIHGENYSYTLSRKNKQKKHINKRVFSSKKSIKKISTEERENNKVVRLIVNTIQNLFL